MECIELKRTLPRVFADRGDVRSEVWQQDCTFERGKRYLVEAASGTGKSSLCSFIYGYRRDYEGVIGFDGKDIRGISPQGWTEVRRRSLSLLFQELRIFPELTAMENVLLKNQLTGFKGKKEIVGLLEALGVAEKRDERMGRLSYGQQQRVAFVRALCQPFSFILLDEPISHLDAENGARMAQLLTEEAGRQGAGVIVTSIGKHLELDYDRVLKL